MVAPKQEDIVLPHPHGSNQSILTYTVDNFMHDKYLHMTGRG